MYTDYYYYYYHYTNNYECVYEGLYRPICDCVHACVRDFRVCAFAVYVILCDCVCVCDCLSVCVCVCVCVCVLCLRIYVRDNMPV